MFSLFFSLFSIVVFFLYFYLLDSYFSVRSKLLIQKLYVKRINQLFELGTTP